MGYRFSAAMLGLACWLAAATGSAAPAPATVATAGPRLAPAPLLAPDDFTRPPRVRQARLSPDGSRLAYLEAEGDSATLSVFEPATRRTRRLLAIGPDTQLHWASGGELLFAVSDAGVSAFDVKDGASRRMASLGSLAAERTRRFAGVDPALPRHILVREHDRSKGRHRLLRIGPDGAEQLLYDDPRAADDFLFDAAGALRLVRVRDAMQRQLVLRAEGGGWAELTRCAPFRACALLALSGDGRRVLMRTVHAGDRAVLSELPLAGGPARVVHSDPLALADLDAVVLEPRTGTPLLAGYALPARRHYGLTPAARTATADIARRLPGASVSIEAGARRWLLAERGARLNQPRFWLYDLSTRKVDEVLRAERVRARPLPEAQLAETKPLAYKASDGATVHGYLTLPPGRPASTLPLLALVHGGPWGHVDGDYSALVQLLANRGYAVFQPNFRASTGYGERYMHAPGADFGNGRVQADIVDGVRWLLAQGVGDARRLGILGSSFGGYAALLGLSHTPDLFQVGIALQPMPDFARVLRLGAAAPARDGEAPFAARLAALGLRPGDAAAMQRLELDSPLAHAAAVRKPLLVVAGGSDDKVEIGAVTDYVARLVARRQPVSLLVLPGEGHVVRTPLARRAQLHLVLRMLQAHLGGPPLPAPDKELADYLARNLRTNGALPG
jgi:dipeptidyl aminopeptidase/acylaminoacyl peptidase